jgi:hypothetical protein
MVTKLSAEEFSQLVYAFSPDSVDFGRIPRSPVDIAGDIAIKVADKLESHKSKGKEK